MKAFDYNQIADNYDQWYATPLGKQIDEWEKKLFLLHLEKLATRNILEIGAGTGHWTQFLSSNGFTVTGIDIAEKMLDHAHKKNIPNASFQVASAEALPFADASVENVVAVTSLEFVKNQQKAFD
ncbi:MAG: class I SAM-dependent methyltransferase, partial [Bacteroidales bacterium]|nr:class I SAM-dependent methyltransferase [Bacteroidales bacterium]